MIVVIRLSLRSIMSMHICMLTLVLFLLAVQFRSCLSTIRLLPRVLVLQPDQLLTPLEQLVDISLSPSLSSWLNPLLLRRVRLLRSSTIGTIHSDLLLWFTSRIIQQLLPYPRTMEQKLLYLDSLLPTSHESKKLHLLTSRNPSRIT